MEKNTGGYSMQDALRIMNSPVGQQLLSLLQQSNDESLKKAMVQAARGDIENARESLRQVAASEDVQKLLSQLGKM